MSNQISRTKNYDNYPKVVSKEDKKAADKLPSYFHNANNRMSMGFKVEKGLREAK